MPISIKGRSRSSSESSSPASSTTSRSENASSSRTTISSMRSAWSKAQSKLTFTASAPNEDSYQARRQRAQDITFTEAVAPVTQGAIAAGNAIKRGGVATGSAIKSGSEMTGKAIVKGGKATGSAIATGSKATGSAIVKGSKATGSAAKAAGSAIVKSSKSAGSAVAQKAIDAKADIKRRATTYGEKLMNMETADLDKEFWATTAGLMVVGAAPAIVMSTAGVGVMGVAMGAAAVALPVAGSVFAGQLIAKNLSKDNIKRLSKKAGNELHIAAEGFASVTGLRKLGRKSKATAQKTRDFVKFLGEELPEAFAEAKSKTKMNAQMRSFGIDPSEDDNE